MNILKKWIMIKLGVICPICGNDLTPFRGCSHTPRTDFCTVCDYKKVYKGKSASGIMYSLEKRCKCGNFFMCSMFAGKVKYICRLCGEEIITRKSINDIKELERKMTDKICKNCKHFACNEKTCIKDSPHLIVTTYEHDSCTEWELNIK